MSKKHYADRNLKFETLQLHVGQETPDPVTDARAVPIYLTSSYVFHNSEHAADRFGLRDAGNIYGRLTNPTEDVFERRIAALEGGVAALAVGSGAAALTYAFQAVAHAGDHIVAAKNIYGGTYNLFAVTMKKMGVDFTFVSPDCTEEELQAAFRPNTKLVFGETVANPAIKVLDIEKFARIAHSHGVPLIVDNTFPTPINCRPFEWGADIVTHSTTKYMDGHGATVGGAIIDSGKFDWTKHADKFPGLCTPDESYHGTIYTEKYSFAPYIVKARMQLMRDFGCYPAANSSFLLNLGLETLPVRMKQYCENALTVAKFLESNDKVESVAYPGLESDKYHKLAEKYLPLGTAGVISFVIKGGRDTAAKFMDSLKLASNEVHVADIRTCILHPASATHRQLSDEQLVAAGINGGMIRLSVGLENVEDIIDDLKQGFAAI